MLLNHFLKVGVAELEDQILCSLSLLVFGVVDVEQFDNIRAFSKAVKYLKFTRHIFSSLSCSLDCHSLFVCAIVSLKYVAFNALGGD